MLNFVPTAPAFLEAPGGAPANVAIAVSHLGGEAAFVGKLGDDEFGRMLAAILRDNGVDAGGVVFDPGARTALAFITLTANDLNIELIKRVLSAMAIGVQLLNICYCQHIPTQGARVKCWASDNEDR